MKSKNKAFFPLFFCAVSAVFLVIAPQYAAENIRTSMDICLKSLIPSLFPFFVLSDILSSSGSSDTLSKLFSKTFKKLFGVSGKGALPFILGLLGGYPTGVKTVCAMYSSGELSKKEAQRLLLFCGNTGPAFIMGAAGAAVFCSVKAGLILYFSHALSAILCGVTSRIFYKNSQIIESTFNVKEQLPFPRVFTESVTHALSGCLNVTAFVMLFSAVSGFIEYSGITNALCVIFELFGCDPVRVKVLITGFTELAGGISALSSHSTDLSFSLPAAAFILGWGGVSVHCQALSFISPSKLKAGGYLISKLCQGITAALLVSLYLRFASPVEVFAFSGHTCTKAFLFDYMGLFFSISCAAAAAVMQFFRKRT